MLRSLDSDPADTNHPSQVDLASFIEGRLDADQSSKIEAHLETCQLCCHALGDLDRNSGVNQALKLAYVSDSAAWNPHSLRIDDAGMYSVDDRYRIIKEIDRGGMGVVQLAQDQHLDRLIALKTLPGGGTSLANRKRFAREARIGARLNHPGIATVHEYGEFKDGRPFMAMKLVRGDTLKTRIEQSDQQTELLSIFVKLCECISYAHSQNVIHRDLKPQNVMVGEFGEVQVMDWGLARLEKVPNSEEENFDLSTGVESKAGDTVKSETENATLAGSIMGTPAYMSPEQAKGMVNEIDERSDVFGLGAILCEILTGKPPFMAETTKDLLRLARDNDLSMTSQRLNDAGHDQLLVDLTLGCLSGDKSKRPSNAAAVANTINDWRESVTRRLRDSELAQASSRTKLIEEQKRHRIQLLLSTSIIGLLLLATWLWSMYQQQNAELVAQTQQERIKKLASATGELKLFEKSLESAFNNFPDDDRDFSEADSCLTRIAPVAVAFPNSELAAQYELAKRELANLRKMTKADKKLMQRMSVLAWTRPPRPNARNRETNANQNATPVGQPVDGIRAGPPNRSVIGRHSRADIQENSANVSKEATMAFVEYSFDPEATRPRQVVEHLASRPPGFRAEITKQMDVWLHYSVVGKIRRRARWITDVMRHLDPDPVRIQIRNAILNRDRAFLATVADLPHLEQQPPELLWSVAALLRERVGDSSLELMEIAQLHHMESSVINRDMARMLERRGRVNEASVYLMIAAANQDDPRTRALGMLHVADSFVQQGALKQAVILLKRVMAIDASLVPEHRFCHTIAGVDSGFAVEQLRVLLEENVLKNPESWIEFGHALREQRDVASAIQAYQNAIDLGLSNDVRKAIEAELVYCELMLLQD